MTTFAQTPLPPVPILEPQAEPKAAPKTEPKSRRKSVLKRIESWFSLDDPWWDQISKGLIVPAVCLAIDPIVFDAYFGFGTPPAGILHEIRGGARLFIVQSMVVFAAWMLIGNRLGPATARLLAVHLYVSAVAAFVLGAVLLPFSLVGLLVMGLGLFGVAPFLTSAAFVRAARAALVVRAPAIRAFPPRLSGVAAVVIGASVVLVPAVVVELFIDDRTARALAAIEAGDEATAARELDALAMVAPLADPIPFADRYWQTRVDEPVLAAAFDAAFARLNGEPVERAFDDFD